MENGSPQPEPRKRTRRFYLVVSTVLLLALVVGVVVFVMFNNSQTYYGPGPVEIEVATEKPSYHQGEEVYFVIYVTNPQDWPVPYPNFAGYQIQKEGALIDSGTGVNVDYPANGPTFPAHSTTPYHPYLLWNQKMDINGTHVQVQPGNYTLEVTLGGYGYDNIGNCTFEIL